jgi:hypothetical protein
VCATFVIWYMSVNYCHIDQREISYIINNHQAILAEYDPAHNLKVTRAGLRNDKL